MSYIGHSLKRLEDQLGTHLFVRHASGMDLTEFGVALRRHAELVEFESDRVVTGGGLMPKGIQTVEFEHRPGRFDAIEPTTNVGILEES